MHDEKESAISRWSRRKHETQKTADGMEPSEFQPDPVNTPQPMDNPVEKTEPLDIHSLTDDDMPDIESLTQDSDFQGFLSRQVSAALRKQALRKLFANDSFNFRDGLDEYDGDYTNFAKLDPGIITADMKHRLELEAKEKLQEIAEETLQEQQDMNSPSPEQTSHSADAELELEPQTESPDASTGNQDDDEPGQPA